MFAAAPLLSACGDDDGGNGGPDAGRAPDGGGGARVAVVGGGLAGLHCAYRLMQEGVDVSVFEASGRTGGRTFTARGMLPDKQIAELGGEFIDSGHECMLALAEELGFELDDLTASVVGDTYYFNGQLILEKDIVAEFVPVAERMTASIALEEDDNEFARLDNMSIPAWLADPNEGNAGPLISELLNVAYTGEYGLDSDVQSVWNLLYLIDSETPDPFRIYGDSDERYHLHLGSDSLAGTLAEMLAGRIQVNTVLTALARDGSRYRVSFDRDAGTLEDTFDHVVLAIPFATLRDVNLSAAELPEEKLDVIQQIGYGTNAKLIGSFLTRPWNNLPTPASGSSFTDFPYRNTWDSSRGQAGEHGILTNFLGGTRGVEVEKGTARDQFLLALDDIDTVFPGTKDQFDDTSTPLRATWRTMPFNKGSYACYTVGQWAFYGLEGEPAGNIHFCGEHTSLDFQGYMEGACETGARAAADVLASLGISAGTVLRRFLARRIPSTGLHGGGLRAERRRARTRTGVRRRMAR